MSFQKTAIKSAQIYYNFLLENKKGENYTFVHHVENAGNSFVLHLTTKLHIVDHVQIKIGTTLYSREQIKIDRYDHIRKKLVITPQRDLIDIVSHANPRDIIVYSDLKYLVERLREWYQEYGILLSLPSNISAIPMYDESTLSSHSSEDQREAIALILSSPFSYVWGAPGTGKTRYVLARSILAYIKAKKKVLLLAPTNIALEQSLFGILDVLKDAGIAINDCVLRLGISTDSFAEKYPDICESRDIAKKLHIVRSQKQHKQRVITDTNTLINEKKELSAIIRSIADEIEYIFAKFIYNIETKQNIKTVNENLEKLTEERITLSSELDILYHTKSQISLENEKLETKTNRFYSSILSRLQKKKYECIVANIKNNITRIIEINKKIESIKAKLSNISEKIIDTKENKEQLILQQTSNTNSIKQLFENSKWLKTKLPPSLFDTEEAVKLYLWKALFSSGSVQDVLPKKFSLEVLKGAYWDDKFTFISKQIETLTQKMKEASVDLQILEQQETDITTSNSRYNMSKYLVLAATVDTFFVRINPGEHSLSHIFLDEAGYCSMIKGCIPFGYGCPVTFLGDHMQLPPVCEMPDKTIENNLEAVLWAQSALFAEQAFSETIESIWNYYHLNESAPFKKMKKHDLIYTHRFGKNLASILAHTIYSDNFQSCLDANTEIFYIDAKRLSNDRTSPEEVEKIYDYLSNNIEESIGILTPYRKQQELLYKRCHIFTDDIFTIHKSQGREWDSVILSIVDTTNKFYTTTIRKNGIGKKILNTAISRAKKKLIIVCDADYWKSQRRELLYELLNQGIELTSN